MKTLKRSCVLAVALSALLCAGCDIRYENKGTPTPQYKCDSAQLELVKKQVEVCDNTGYLGSFCWDTARAEQCTVVKEGT